jgi:hypothetical protein
MRFNLIKDENKRTLVASILVAIFIIGACILGSYHLVHGGGWRSGVAELAFALWVAVLGFGFDQIGSNESTLAQSRYLHIAWLISLWGLAIVLFILSLYHFTHQGLPSGSIEMIFFVLLTFTAFLTA